MSVTPEPRREAVGIRSSDVARHPELATRLRPGELVALDDAAWSAAPLVLELRAASLWLVGRRDPVRGAASIDFVSGRLGQRLDRISRRSEPLLRAVGATEGRRPRVVDGTAGWGRDTGLLAQHGCEVVALERSAVMASLLANALKRAAESDSRQALAGRVELRQVDTREHLSLESDSSLTAHDCVLLDPMFPETRRSALVKLPLRLASLAVGRDDDADGMLRSALQSGAGRVVVRRPPQAPPLNAGRDPDFVSPGGRTTRYDVYLPRASER